MGQACVCWPIRADRVVRRGGDLKETGAKTECFRWRGNSGLQQYDKSDEFFLSISACKPILVVTQNNVMSLHSRSPLNKKVHFLYALFVNASVHSMKQKQAHSIPCGRH